MVPRGGMGGETRGIAAGDVMWVPAGTVAYLVNVDAREELHVAVLLKPVSSVDGEYREFFGAGGVEPESFLRAFSEKTLEAAFNSRKEELERILGKQKKGVFVEATEEQITSITYQSEERRRSFPLLSQKPSFSNAHGQLYEVSAEGYSHLRELDADVSLANITAGGMVAPSYNTRATKIAFVVGGEGYVEMAWPCHESGDYKRVAAKVSTGDVFVIPAGQPVVTVAGTTEGLQILCFGLQAGNNRRIYITGGNGALKKLEDEAKELSFGVPLREIDDVLNAQKQSVFMQGPGAWQSA
ncbi:cupin family protein [Wolffia australiana]